MATIIFKKTMAVIKTRYFNCLRKYCESLNQIHKYRFKIHKYKDCSPSSVPGCKMFLSFVLDLKILFCYKLHLE